MTDEEIIQEAEKRYELGSDDNILVQGLDAAYTGNLEVIDRVANGAWVMAWVWVPIEGEES